MEYKKEDIKKLKDDLSSLLKQKLPKYGEINISFKKGNILDITKIDVERIDELSLES